MLLQSVSKQWGKILGDTVNLKIINFPVSFNECFGGLALFNGDPVAAAEYATITDITNTNFKIYMYANNAGTGYANANIFYLFLGAQQQWGNSWSGYTGVFNWYFPISPSQVYAACLTKHTKNISSSHNWEPARVEEWNNSYARIHPDGDLGYSVIAICKAQQQWGFTVFDPVYYKNVNFTLPLSVNGTFCAFSTGYDAKGSTFLWHSMSHFNNVNVGVTGFVFDSRYTFTGLGYLAVCWQKQWGKYTNSGNDRVITYPIAFSELYYANVISPDNCETFVYGISNTNINYRLCNGYNDDRWNGTQTSRLFAVGR